MFAFKDSEFDWKNASQWEWADGVGITGGNKNAEISTSGIKLNRIEEGKAKVLRTKDGWRGSKIIYIEWISNELSDANIWMLNLLIKDQFGENNGWPYNGELDLFEMFTADKELNKQYDFSGFKQFADVASYGQTTFHMGGKDDVTKPCFCPSSPSKTMWYDNSAPLTSACTAQFKNRPNAENRLAVVFKENSQYEQ